ncbi:MAG: pyridoxal 5'-phosphate synthase glutaminase subunit PdxT [Meiothermus sp.]|uniref:pyridoxal 5'-phosphate synthase glutaminase subunit PdxT n=1 Tax=Meiothermus sp. TaxID=1955249 RepID=UPI0025E97B72|nr:pyridoxal 5'-phosphate synthase glutaminase subunit PdxT [Meiothermus sp.]MCS7057976.1 pyridoxal 5'-phosphate synthase glutaminase subunit PdxT [Meiothermus sp.]MCS7194530.1 pyridoxal 5'-phosphate synthase glutaminase subunit PdxT [Meiothermus sp.]MCX7740490.1 pyridoxal 5'-phosphate synthase glutaminase subunit PdxT [Meiothermus sp.]MDW8091886.1 pyridoxal 5'-phosphate synthase glutaminase subunit PdxT [Meiothermus sp.]MDW8480871.1 pyridoxal 5'-phosphate synthase glutaminase subunit PdxT [Me
MRVGVLALQGDVREHKRMLEDLRVEVREVRLPQDLEGLQGLVVPGGESTTIGMLAREYGLEEEVRQRVERGDLAVWGTCAGAIWLAKELPRYPTQPRLGVLDVVLERNAYGRQVDSFEEDVEVRGLDRPFHAFFIRAPRILQVGPGVEVLAQWGDEPVLVRSGRLMASTFHPELSGDPRIHRMFLELASG